MEAGWFDGRIFAGLLMYAIAAGIYWRSPAWRPARWLAIYLVLRGTLNLALPFSLEHDRAGSLDPVTAFVGHLHIGAAMSGLLFGLIFIDARRPWAWWLIATTWILLEVAYTVDRSIVWDGPLYVVIGLAPAAYFIMGHMFFFRARRTTDLVLKSGLTLAGITSWAFPAFAGAFRTGALVWDALEGRMPGWDVQVAYNLVKVIIFLSILTAIVGWASRRRGLAALMTVSIGLGLLPWAMKPLGGDPAALARGGNALTTLAMPVGLGVAVSRIQRANIDGRLRRPFRLITLGFFGGTLGATILQGLTMDPPLDRAFLILGALIAGTIPWWNQWAQELTRSTLPAVPAEMSLHARVTMLQTHYQRHAADGWRRGRAGIEQLAKALGIPRSLIDRLGPATFRLR